MKTSQAQVMLAVCHAILEAIRDLKQVPSGELYAVLSGKLSLDTYQSIIEVLENSGRIRVDNHLITFIR